MCSVLQLLLISALAPGPASAFVKTWGRDLNVDSAANWGGARGPCPGQVAVLPDSQPLAVYVHKKMVTRQLILPKNGELIFGNGAFISFADTVAAGDSRCKGAVGGSTVTFRSTSGDRWFDADSWRQAVRPSPVPHADRVPCPGDEVRFPDNMTYRALVKRPVTVAALSVGPYGMNNARFRTFRNTSVGRALFDVREKFNISTAQPCNSEDCVCGNDRQEVLSAICAATSCEEALCDDPVQPVGHCCKMCGAFVRVTAGSQLRASQVSDLVRQAGSSSRVRWHVGRTHDRQIQAVLVDAAEGRQDSSRLARSLYAQLTGSPQYGVSSSVIAASGPRHAPLVGGSGSGSPAGVVIGVLLVVVLVALLVCAARTGRLPCRSGVWDLPPPSEWRLASQASALVGRLPDWELSRRVASTVAAPFHFARFRNDESGEVELGQRAEPEEVPDSASDETGEPDGHDKPDTPVQPLAPEAPVAGRSFDNPMFNDPRVDEHAPASPLTPGSAVCVTPDGKSVTNPFFGVPNITVSDADTAPLDAIIRVEDLPAADAPEDSPPAGSPAEPPEDRREPPEDQPDHETDPPTDREEATLIDVGDSDC